MSKTCSAEGCDAPAAIRVQPLKKITWDYFCNRCWITLAINTVREAHEAGYLITDKPDATPTLTIVDSQSNTLV